MLPPSCEAPSPAPIKIWKLAAHALGILGGSAGVLLVLFVLLTYSWDVGDSRTGDVELPEVSFSQAEVICYDLLGEIVAPIKWIGDHGTLANLGTFVFVLLAWGAIIYGWAYTLWGIFRRGFAHLKKRASISHITCN